MVPGVTDFFGGILIFRKLLVVDGGESMGGVVTFTLVDNGGIEFSVFGTTKLLAPVIRLFCITG